MSRNSAQSFQYSASAAYNLWFRAPFRFRCRTAAPEITFFNLVRLTKCLCFSIWTIPQVHVEKSHLITVFRIWRGIDVFIPLALTFEALLLISSFLLKLSCSLWNTSAPELIRGNVKSDQNFNVLLSFFRLHLRYLQKCTLFHPSWTQKWIDWSTSNCLPLLSGKRSGLG